MSFKTGFKELDDIIGGLKAKDFISIASRPGMGKSSLAINIINNIGVQTEDKILYFNLETNKERLGDRILNDNVEIVDTPSITIEDIKKKCEEISKDGLVLVVIDYVQLIGTSSIMKNRFEEMAYISRTLKLIALELNVPILVLSQLNRLQTREDKRPILADFNEGSLVQDSDKIIFLYRESYYMKDYELDDGELIVAKNRGGLLGTVKVVFDKDTLTFK